MLFRRQSFSACLVLVLATSLACESTTSAQTGTAVDVNDNTFQPSNLRVTAGQTVTWTWKGTQPHTVTFDAGAPNSTQITTGTFQRQFTTAGTFPYHCLVHGTAMSGTITVQ